MTFEGPRKKVTEKGTETVKLESTTSKKTSFIAFDAIPLAGQKFPLWVLAKGRIQRCERRFGIYTDVNFRHTDKGWSTDNLIVSYIN
jgi:hypothetical protein